MTDEFEGEGMDVRLLRRHFGLKEITYRSVQCRAVMEQKNFSMLACDTKFSSQFVGERRVEWYCARCRHYMRMVQNDDALADQWQ